MAADVVQTSNMNTAERESFARVRELLIQDFRIKPRKVTPEARIREDLGICGADGIDLFDALHERCGVDLAGYDHEQYFEPEMWGTGAFFTWKWWTTFKHPKTLTVAHLAYAVAAGRWDDDLAQQRTPSNPHSPSAQGAGGR